MKLHSVLISYHRLELTQRALASYLETVSVPYTLVVVDNGSGAEVESWLTDNCPQIILLGRNHYPGYACNRGWELAPGDADFLHRADNDFTFREGWCETLAERFCEDESLGQVGLLTDEQESFAPLNVGGNCVIRRKLWDEGLRYDERPWPEMDKGYSEDSYFSPSIVEMGYTWGRVRRTCIDGISTPDPSDRYYRSTYRDRHILSVLKQIENP